MTVITSVGDVECTLHNKRTRRQLTISDKEEHIIRAIDEDMIHRNWPVEQLEYALLWLCGVEPKEDKP